MDKIGGVNSRILKQSKESYTADDLNAMTIAEIKSLAENLGYGITKTKKSDIIQEFLNQQEN